MQCKNLLLFLLAGNKGKKKIEIEEDLRKLLEYGENLTAPSLGKSFII